MNRRILTALAVTAVFMPAISQAKTVTTGLLYEATDVGLDGGNAVAFNAFTTLDLGIADLRFGAAASGGEVDARGAINFSTSFEETVSLADADSFFVGLGLNSLGFRYDAFTGADAGAFVDFKSFSGVNLNEFRVIGDDYTLNTADNRNSFGNTGSNSDTQRLTGLGPNISFGLGVRAEVTLNASQTTSMTVNDFQGTVIAQHESGVFRFADFSLQNDPSKMLDLSLEGAWDLSLTSLALRNSFDSSTGLAPGYELGLAFGEVLGGCGNYATDDDNAGFLDLPEVCVADTGISGTGAQLTLLDPSAFEIDWGTKSVQLGAITVLGDPTVATVPLPAGLPLLAVSLFGFAGLRKLQKRA